MKTVAKIVSLSNDLSLAFYKRAIDELNSCELENVIGRAVMSVICEKWNDTETLKKENRRAYYFSAEFLIGRLSFNNFLSINLLEELKDEFEKLGVSLNILEKSGDPALGNGGLGRLAACFLDSAASLSLPLDGYGIRYKYGMFRQKIENGFQTEYPDEWLKNDFPWEIERKDRAVTVNFKDMSVLAVPYDIPVIGYKCKSIGTLRLWESQPLSPFDFDSFNQQNYKKATEYKTESENISRVLYPNDSARKGKILRLRQQYFFCSASLQDIFREYNGDRERIEKNVSIQLNDTHPVISIPEYIRLLISSGENFKTALESAKKVFNYTNHTVLPEALEKWDMKLLSSVLPEIARIIRRIDRACIKELAECGVDGTVLNNLQIIKDNTVNMAYLACYCSEKINGVAKIHTEILKESVLADWHSVYPQKFNNKTNGITQRRWLKLCNSDLAALITELLNTDKWVTDLSLLKNLEQYADDEAVIDRFITIRHRNKIALKKYINERDGVVVDDTFLLDVQIKRLHEYKRQLLNILAILEIYFRIKEGTVFDFKPTLFLFGAKAAPGYFRAKAIIKLINEVAKLIDEDEIARQYIKVLFVNNYDVSYAEKIIAAADVSEQISTAGTEASGTGNMKLMLNGAVTLGTYDGANIEIVSEAGEENNYIFGARVEEILNIRESYNPMEIYEQNYSVKRCLDCLVNGTLSDDGTGMFEELYNSVLKGADWHKADNYFLLYDFEDYVNTKLRVNTDAKDKRLFYKKCWLNMCNAGYFSSDRTIKEYAKDIWKINKL